MPVRFPTFPYPPWDLLWDPGFIRLSAGQIGAPHQSVKLLLLLTSKANLPRAYGGIPHSAFTVHQIPLHVGRPNACIIYWLMFRASIE